MAVAVGVVPPPALPAPIGPGVPGPALFVNPMLAAPLLVPHAAAAAQGRPCIAEGYVMPVIHPVIPGARAAVVNRKRRRECTEVLTTSAHAAVVGDDGTLSLLRAFFSLFENSENLLPCSFCD